MNRAHITSVFSQAPASFQFQEAQSGDGPRLLGASIGAALQLDGPVDDLTSAVLSAVAPPDNELMARRCGVLLVLIMVAFAPKWHAGHNWVTGCLQVAARTTWARQTFSNRHAGWRYELRTDRARSLATLSITKE